MRAIVLVLDSLGIGALPDARSFGDEGANTLGHIAAHCSLSLPHLEERGLGFACELASGVLPRGFSPHVNVIGAYGAARELSSGKDTVSGHWEMAGVPVRFEWGYFRQKNNSIPVELLARIAARASLTGWLGNCHASGTAIINALGAEHLSTGKPIVYTSADSVVQIAVHEASFGLERLYSLCQIAREEVDPYRIGRVIARPFAADSSSNFVRTPNRRDYAVPPPADTLLKKLVDAGGRVTAIGKIADIYAHIGITHRIKASGLNGLWDATLQAVREAQDVTLVMTNFVDFDQEYGHRREVTGYARALESFDRWLPRLDALLGENDIVLLTADHGCDPTWPGSDHTREHVPILVWGEQVRPSNLGVRASFADIGQSLASWFRVAKFVDGDAFL